MINKQHFEFDQGKRILGYLIKRMLTEVDIAGCIKGR